jgi:hypothetical protein
VYAAIVQVKHVLPNAGFSAADDFRSSLRRPDVLAVYKHYRGPLWKMFKYYSRADNQGKTGATVNMKEYYQMLTDCLLTDGPGGISLENARKLLIELSSGFGAQDLSYSEATARLDLSFPEFLESLAVLAVQRFANPYKPLALRLEGFITERLLANIKRKMGAALRVPSKPAPLAAKLPARALTEYTQSIQQSLRNKHRIQMNVADLAEALLGEEEAKGFDINIGIVSSATDRRERAGYSQEKVAKGNKFSQLVLRHRASRTFPELGQ